MKRSHLLCLTMLLFTFACSEKKLDAKQYRASNEEQTLTIQKELPLEDPAKDIIYPTNFVYHDDFFTLMDPAFGQICLIFNHDGTLRKKIGNKGQGPGEYQMPMAFTVAEDQIFLVSGDRRINRYDIDGKFQEASEWKGTGIVIALYPHGRAAIGTLLSRYLDYGLFTLDERGQIDKTFAKPPKEMGYAFDTFAPAGGLLVEDQDLHHFRNYRYEMLTFDINGNLKETKKLVSARYKEGSIKEAKKVQGHKEERKFRTTFTAFRSLYKYGDGYVTELANANERGQHWSVLELWDADFNSLGYVNIGESRFIGTVGKSLVFFENEDQAKLIFKEIATK